MIALRNIEKGYRTGSDTTFVLRNVSLDIRDGEFVTVMGPSGAGKSTLLSIVGMLDGEYSGEYHLFDHPVHSLKPRQRVELGKRYVGFVFQQYHLIDDLTVRENIDLPLSYRDVKKRDRDSAVADALDQFQIVAKKDLYPSQLSGGQQQLVAVARAIIGKPKIILADEPTGSLHSSQGQMIMDMLRTLNQQGTTIIQVTHNERWAGYGDRIIELFDGWVQNDAGAPATTLQES